jgi:hypothetical protein
MTAKQRLDSATMTTFESALGIVAYSENHGAWGMLLLELLVGNCQHSTLFCRF